MTLTPDAEAPGEMRHRFAQAQPLTEQHRPEQMDADVPVAELEPRLLTEAPQHRLRVKGVVANAEPGRLVEDAREPVEDRIDIG